MPHINSIDTPKDTNMSHQHDIAHDIEQVARRAHAEGKESYFRLHRYRYEAILAAMHDAPIGARVLEIGVTPGQCTQLLVKRGYQVSGVDLDPSGRQALWDELGVEVRQMNLEREPIPFADESFDWVVFSEVIEHLVFSPLPVLRECRRVLVPGGKLVITTPNELYLKSRLRSLVRLLAWQSLATPSEFEQQMKLEGEARYTTHSRIYTMRELRWAMEYAHFRIVQQRYEAAWERVGVAWDRLRTNPVGAMGKGILTALTTLLPPTRSMLVVVGEKG